MNDLRLLWNATPDQFRRASAGFQVSVSPLSDQCPAVSKTALKYRVDTPNINGKHRKFQVYNDIWRHRSIMFCLSCSRYRGVWVGHLLKLIVGGVAIWVVLW